MRKILAVLVATLLVISTSIGGAEAKVRGGYSQNDVRVKSGLSQEKIEQLLPKNMKSLAPAFYKIENSKKPINALFLASVVRLETGNGTSYSYRARNNVGGVMGRSGLRTFSSKEECLYYMQDFLYRGYINNGRRNVWNIGSKYCVGGNWAYKVNRLAINSMQKSWGL